MHYQAMHAHHFANSHLQPYPAHHGGYHTHYCPVHSPDTRSFAQSPLQSCNTPHTSSMPCYTSEAISPLASPMMPPCAHEDSLAQKIAKAIDGQYTAVCCYEKLMQQAPQEEDREQISEIRNDEIKHYQTFQRIYASLTGRQHTAQMTETCPERYIDGLLAAFKDEQKTTDFYLEIAASAKDPYIKEQFHHAAHDEQQHAVWFLFLYSKECYAPLPNCTT